MKTIIRIVPFLILSTVARAEYRGPIIALRQTIPATPQAVTAETTEPSSIRRFSVAIEPVAAILAKQYSARVGVRVTERLILDLAGGSGVRGATSGGFGSALSLTGGYYVNPALVIQLTGRAFERGWYLRTGPIYAWMEATEYIGNFKPTGGTANSSALAWMATSGYQAGLGGGLYIGAGLGVLIPLRNAQFLFPNGDRATGGLAPIRSELVLGLSF